jgi:hypothetical protein
MKLQDALFNWLQMHIVAEGRPDDGAAKETLDFFVQILREDHAITEINVNDSDNSFIVIEYSAGGDAHSMKFLRESAEQLLADIEANPKYNSCME